MGQTCCTHRQPGSKGDPQDYDGGLAPEQHSKHEDASDFRNHYLPFGAFVSCGDLHSAAVTENGTLITWGYQGKGQLGHAHNEKGNLSKLLSALEGVSLESAMISGASEMQLAHPRPVQAFSGKIVATVSCGYVHSAAVVSGGDLYTWGWGVWGVLGHGNLENHSIPSLVSSLRGVCVVLVACGAEHTAAVTNEGRLYTWGKGEHGALGHGDMKTEYLPKLVDALQHETVEYVTCGQRHTAAITSDKGNLYTWGWGNYGQLGHGDTLDRSTPTVVDHLEKYRIKMVACGGGHTAAVTSDGCVYTWGDGRCGQLGHGQDQEMKLLRKSSHHTPRVILSLVGTKIKTVACGSGHSAAVSETGALWTWGWGKFCQLGHGDARDQLSPRQVTGLAGLTVSAIACGSGHTLASAVGADGFSHVYSWGMGKFGQLGHGESTDQHYPKVVRGLEPGQIGPENWWQRLGFDSHS